MDEEQQPQTTAENIEQLAETLETAPQQAAQPTPATPTPTQTEELADMAELKIRLAAAQKRAGKLEELQAEKQAIISENERLNALLNAANAEQTALQKRVEELVTADADTYARLSRIVHADDTIESMITGKTRSEVDASVQRSKQVYREAIAKMADAQQPTATGKPSPVRQPKTDSIALLAEAL